MSSESQLEKLLPSEFPTSWDSDLEHILGNSRVTIPSSDSHTAALYSHDFRAYAAFLNQWIG